MSATTSITPIVAAAGTARRSLSRGVTVAMEEWAGKSRAGFDRNHVEPISEAAQTFERKLAEVAKLCEQALRDIEIQD